MAGETYVLGSKAKIMLGAAELSNVKDVTLTMTAAEADITTRANQGWKATAPTLKECSVEFQMQHKPGDTGFAAIRAAFLDSTVVDLKVLTDTEANSGEGPHGKFAVTGFTRNEALADAINYSVTCKMSEFTAWIGGGA